MVTSMNTATVATVWKTIPALIAYNAFVSGIKEMGDELRHFSSELINVVVRERRS